MWRGTGEMQSVPVVLLLCLSPPSDPSNWHVVQAVDAAAMLKAIYISLIHPSHYGILWLFSPPQIFWADNGNLPLITCQTSKKHLLFSLRSVSAVLSIDTLLSCPHPILNKPVQQLSCMNSCQLWVIHTFLFCSFLVFLETTFPAIPTYSTSAFMWPLISW